MNVKHIIEDKLLIFEIVEELDHHTCDKIRKRTDYEIQRFMPKKVILDLKNVKFMDSAGIGFVLGRYKVVNSFGGTLEIVNVEKTLKKIFEMSGMLKIIPIVQDYSIKNII